MTPTEGMNMEWISVKEKLPPLSYVESDNADDEYKAHYVLLYSNEKTFCVGYLVKEQDEEKWSCGDLSWEVLLPGEDWTIHDINFDIFTHWCELPKPPCIYCEEEK